MSKDLNKKFLGFSGEVALLVIKYNLRIIVGSRPEIFGNIGAQHTSSILIEGK